MYDKEIKYIREVFLKLKMAFIYYIDSIPKVKDYIPCEDAHEEKKEIIVEKEVERLVV